MIKINEFNIVYGIKKTNLISLKHYPIQLT